MKLIILAAGEGTRLRPYTEDKPKCMVKFQGTPIIDTILENASSCDISDINIATGYKVEVLRGHVSNTSKRQVKFHHNEKYDSTNMLYTLFCAKDALKGDCIISYADIVYKKSILEQIKDEKESSIVVDKNWRELWEKRMDDPLSDAETLKVDQNGYVIELGKKPTGYHEIEGQYIGLIKFAEKDMERIKSIYDELDRNVIYDGKNFENMYMTSFLQILIDSGIKLKASYINGGWVEIDSTEDLQRLQDYNI